MINQVNKSPLSVHKYILLASIGLMLFACQDSYTVEKPNQLIAKEQMIDILEDMLILDAAKNVSKRQFEVNDIQLYNYIITKYDIDSITLRENLEYYNQQFDENLEIYDSVKARIDNRKKIVDSIVKRQDSLEVANRNNKNENKSKVTKKQKTNPKFETK